LAKATPIALELIGFFDVLPGAGQVLPALLLVVTRLGNRPDRAAVDAFAASAIGEIQAIGPVVDIRPRRRLKD
jgi:hypothetical protein